MAVYRLVLDGLAAFVVDITSTSGNRSMRRFPSEAAALMWIAEQEFHDAATGSCAGGQWQPIVYLAPLTRSRSQSRSVIPPVPAERQKTGWRTVACVRSTIGMVA